MGNLVNIIKGSIRNTVDEYSFKKLYEPNGWRIDDAKTQEEKQIPLNELKTLNNVNNYVKMANTKAKKFNDNLFYSDVGNEMR